MENDASYMIQGVGIVEIKMFNRVVQTLKSKTFWVEWNHVSLGTLDCAKEGYKGTLYVRMALQLPKM